MREGRTYIGSKRTLVPTIASLVTGLPIRTACDLFTGTTRVAQGLKALGLHVTANDVASYSYEFALAFIEGDARRLDSARLERLLDELRQLPPVDGYFTRTFCVESRYFRPENGRVVDAVRRGIDSLDVTRVERAVLLTALILAADRVDSTTGVQMAYLKTWAPRAFKPLELRMPQLLPGPGRAFAEDAIAFVERGGTRGIDLTYVDPPYNQHSYFGNYHVWETLVRGDEPAAYGIARKRVDTNENRSVFNSSRYFRGAFTRLIDGIESPFVLVSLNNEGYLREDELLQLLSRRGYVEHVSVDFKRYVGAQIGIYNPSGERVGRISHLRNREMLFLAGDERQVKGGTGVAALSSRCRWDWPGRLSPLLPRAQVAPGLALAFFLPQLGGARSRPGGGGEEPRETASRGPTFHGVLGSARPRRGPAPHSAPRVGRASPGGRDIGRVASVAVVSRRFPDAEPRPADSSHPRLPLRPGSPIDVRDEKGVGDGKGAVVGRRTPPLELRSGRVAAVPQRVAPEFRERDRVLYHVRRDAQLGSGPPNLDLRDEQGGAPELACGLLDERCSLGVARGGRQPLHEFHSDALPRLLLLGSTRRSEPLADRLDDAFEREVMLEEGNRRSARLRAGEVLQGDSARDIRACFPGHAVPRHRIPSGHQSVVVGGLHRVDPLEPERGKRGEHGVALPWFAY